MASTDAAQALAQPRPLAAPPNFAVTCWCLLGRQLRQEVRQPIWLVVTLVQPVIWLWLFGQLFKGVVSLPGFGGTSYIDFLAPGIVIMTALFSASWSGMGTLTQVNEGVLARFLTTPAHRMAIIVATVVSSAVGIMVQGVIILGISYALGARLHSLGGAALLIIAGGLVACGFAALSLGLALLLLKEESLIAVVNFISLPLNFLSPVLMAAALMPPWMRVASRFNPVSWAVTAGRGAVASVVPWGSVLGHCALLLALALALMGFATWAFEAYRRAL